MERQLPSARDDLAPDGSEVRVLCGLDGASTAHFALGPGEVSRAMAHRTVSEIWYVLGGQGRMWREFAGRGAEIPLRPGLSLTLPVGTRFQFRNDGAEPLTVLGVTLPPWPGPDEAVQVDGQWAPSV